MFTPDGSLIEKGSKNHQSPLILMFQHFQVIILCFVVADSLQGFILFWIFTFNKRVFDLYSKLWQRLKVRSVALQEERDRLRLRAAMVRQQSQSLEVAELEGQSNKLTNIVSWLVRSRKESGASVGSTSTQATTVKPSVSARCWDTLTEEYEDRLSGLDQVESGEGE